MGAMTSGPGQPDAIGPAGGEGADDLEPYLALAREIRRDVERIVADDDAAFASVAEVIDRYPTAERERVVRAVFDRLEPTDQWEILARTFDDAELRRFLADEHAAATQRARYSVGGLESGDVAPAAREPPRYRRPFAT